MEFIKHGRYHGQRVLLVSRSYNQISAIIICHLGVIETIAEIFGTKELIDLKYYAAVRLSDLGRVSVRTAVMNCAPTLDSLRILFLIAFPISPLEKAKISRELSAFVGNG